MMAELKKKDALIAVLEDQIQKLALQREDDKKIITELADAFSETFNALLSVSDVDYEGDSVEDSAEWKLIQRARDAVK